mmetsp:Transcript_1295/g.1734  ORF Transcript_1295/g.1734 Transcript_1295/m.1734 type:complete len:587 (-) Transcript_1295:163-1923(-)
MEDQTGVPYQVEYAAPSALQWYQDAFPRFGHTSNLTKVFESGSSSDTQDYAAGLIFVGCIIMGFFLLWSVVLMIFMCIGHKAGFLSGVPFLRKPVQTAKSDGDSVDGADGLNGPSSYHLNKSLYYGDPWRSRPTISRVCFIISGIICITFGLLLVTEGVTNLQTGINTINDNSIKLNKLAGDARLIIQEGMLEMKDMATNIRGIVENELAPENFCPDDPLVTGSEVGRDIRERSDEALDLLQQLDDFQESELNDVEEAMKIMYDGTDEIISQAADVDVSDWQSLIVIIPYTIFPALLMVAAVLAMFDVASDRYHCFISWFVLPIFIVMTIVAAAFAAIMAMAAGVNGDFCLPGGRDDSSPDDLVRDIMRVEGYDNTTYAFRVADWYINQCQSVEDPLNETRSFRPDLNSSRSSLQDLIDDIRIDGKLDELGVYCNRDYDTLDILLESMQSIVDVLIQSLDRLLDLVACGRIIPLYTSTVYDAGCSYSPKAVIWVFSCCLILAFFGMVMITLRSSMKMTLIDQDFVGHFPHAESQDFHHQEEYSGEQVDEVEPNLHNLEEEEIEIEYPSVVHNPHHEPSQYEKPYQA